MNEYIIRTDMFKNPLVETGSKAKALKILRLIYLDPGTDPLHPDMGVGIRKYRFGDEDKLDELRIKTNEQIETYLPMLVDCQVNYVVTADKILSIEILAEDEIYEYSDEENPITVESLAV